MKFRKKSGCTHRLKVLKRLLKGNNRIRLIKNKEMISIEVWVGRYN